MPRIDKPTTHIKPSKTMINPVLPTNKKI